MRPILSASLVLLSVLNSAPALAQSSSPQISAVSPTTARAGDQIVINGSNFGSSQGNGNVWLGSTYGVVVSWSDTQVIAAVASGSQSGVAQILQGGVWSNSVNFTVITPNIASVTPATAIAGTQITITGTGFGASQGSGNVWLGSTYGVVVSWSDTQVVANVASGSKSGVAQILQGGVWSNTVNLTVSTPNITSVTPTTAIAGTQITITGTGFGATQGSGNVWLGSTYGVVVSWSDAQVVANVASGSKSGVAQILQSGVWSNTVNLTVSTPNITSVTPTTAIAGTQITITGTGFGTSQGSGNVWLGSMQGVLVSWSDTQIVANVASGSRSGVAQVLQGGVWSNTVNLTVSTPNITSVTPTTAIAGTQITITGTAFGATQGSGNVWLGSTYGVIVSWSDTQVVASVASGSISGVAQILQGGVWSNTVNFTVITPNITSISPASGNAGTQVTITGTGFGTTQGSGNLWLGSTYGVVVSWSDTQVVATVAAGSTTGVAQILQGGVWSNSINFAVTSLNLANLSPVSGPIGAPVTITGSGFGAIQGVSTVSFNGTIARAQTWSDTLIVAVVSSGTTSGPVSVTVGGTTSSSLNFAVTAPPSITSVSPTTGTAGTQVSVTGSGFGSAQAGGTVQLGSRPGAVVSWTDTLIVATVASGSVSGNAQVRQSGVGSNSVAFAVVTATITGVSPTSGAAGTQVTITGSGFGSTQGAGQVSLGTVPAQVTSWSDTQVVATVASGSNSGTAQVLQNGVWSNPVAFTITGGAPHITSISPNRGTSGTVVAIQGTGFGSSQGSGIAWIGAQQASVNSWSDTQVSATVGANALSGIVKIQQNGLWSNAVTFTVPFTVGSGGQVTLNPNVMSMLVGDTRSIQALNSNTQPVTGLTWTSSDSTIVSLSTDNPPVLTAVAPGNVAITAGGASADVTVFAGSTLPLGSVVWSDPGDGSGVDGIFPAVPSPTGLADVFALQGDGTIQAIATDGSVAWAATPAGGFGNSYLADFQGGLVVFGSGTSNNSDTSILKLDGLTGQPYPAYVTTSNEGMFSGLEYPAIHTDGTIFTVDYACLTSCSDPSSPPDTTDGAWVVGIDPSTGSAKFKVQLANQVSQGQTDAFCSAGGLSTYYIHPWPYSLMIAGDGYLYTSYVTEDSVVNSKRSAANLFSDAVYNDLEALQRDTSQSNFGAAINDLTTFWADIPQAYNPGDPLLYALQTGDKYTAVQIENSMATQQYRRLCDRTTNLVTKMHLLRVGTDGSYTDVVADQWTTNSSLYYVSSFYVPYYQQQQTQDGPQISFNNTQQITNADQGALFSWQAIKECYSFATNCTIGVDNHLTSVTGGALAADVIWDAGGYQPSIPVLPVLQLQDGSYVGSVNSGAQNLMMAFDATGGVRWASPNYSPSIATSDGGMIANAGSAYDPISQTIIQGNATTLDANGNAISQLGSLPNFSWKGSYQLLASINSVAVPIPTLATTFAAIGSGNLSGNGSAAVHHSFGLFWCGTGFALQGYVSPGSLTGSLASPCPQGGGEDLRWGYYRIENNNQLNPDDSPNLNYCPAPSCGINSLQDFSVPHPDWVSIIERQAIGSFRAAFANYAIQVQLGTEGPYCPFVIRCSANSTPGQEFTVYVVGDYPFPASGAWFSDSASHVYYFSLMEGAQEAFGQPQDPNNGSRWINYMPSYPPQDTQTFVRMLQAIGKAIGNASAHEIGHHLEHVINLKVTNYKGFPYMDCGLANHPKPPAVAIACEGDNFVYNFYNSSGLPQYMEPASPGAMFFYGVPGGTPGIPIQPPIHWGPSNILWLQHYAPANGKDQQ